MVVKSHEPITTPTTAASSVNPPEIIVACGAVTAPQRLKATATSFDPEDALKAKSGSGESDPGESIGISSGRRPHEFSRLNPVVTRPRVALPSDGQG